MHSTLRDHPIWNELTQTLSQVDPNEIALQHIQACNAQINGYWHEDQFYELVTFTQFPSPELISSSIGVSSQDQGIAHWLKLSFQLTANPQSNSDSPNFLPNAPLGELILLLDENLDVIDENWLIQINSPYIQAHQPAS